MKKKITFLTLLAATNSNIFCAASSTSRLMQRTKYLIAAGAGYWVSKNDPDNNLGKLAEQCVDPLIIFFKATFEKIKPPSKQPFTPGLSTPRSQNTRDDKPKENTPDDKLKENTPE